MNVTEFRDSDFKNAFPGIFNFTVGILFGICLTFIISVIIGVSLSSRNSETTSLPEISEPSVTKAPVTERSVTAEPSVTEAQEEIIPPEKMEYRHEAKDLSNSQIKYIIYQGDKQLSYYKFLTGLENEKQLRDYFRSILNDVPFDTFKWETPSINANTITRPFEFIIGNVLNDVPSR